MYTNVVMNGQGALVSIPRRDGAPLIVEKWKRELHSISRKVSIPRRDGAPLIDVQGGTNQRELGFNSPKGWSAPHSRSAGMHAGRTKSHGFNSPKGWSAPHSRQPRFPMWLQRQLVSIPRRDGAPLIEGKYCVGFLQMECPTFQFPEGMERPS